MITAAGGGGSSGGSSGGGSSSSSSGMDAKERRDGAPRVQTCSGHPKNLDGAQIVPETG